MSILKLADENSFQKFEEKLDWGIDQEESILGKYWSIELENLLYLNPDLDKYYKSTSCLLICIAGNANQPNPNSLKIAKEVLSNIEQYLKLFGDEHHKKWEPYSVLVPYQGDHTIWHLGFISEYGSGIQYAFVKRDSDGYILNANKSDIRDLTNVESVAVTVIDALKPFRAKDAELAEFLVRVDNVKMLATETLKPLKYFLKKHESEVFNFKHFSGLIDSVYEYRKDV